METKHNENVRIWEERVVIPTYETGAPDVNPMFFERRVYQGSSGKVYPLPVTETLLGKKEPKSYTAVFLENKYLKIMLLPELGGRIQRAIDKTNGYDFVYYNQVVKPALVGLAGPWISGGIEFNWPQHHRPSTFLPIEYHLEENEDGSATLFIGETDVMYGTKGMAAITLYPERAYIEIKGRLYNPTTMDQTFLWWANPAVAVNENTFSVFPPDVHAVMDHGKRAVSTFPIATGEYYKFDYSAGVDISRYKNIQVPTSYMAYQSKYDFIGNFDEGLQAGLLHIADHHISVEKKQWTWGNGDFGQAWDRNLTDEDGPYIELMTGVYTDNQPDFTWLAPHEEKTFTQYFMPYKEVGRVTDANENVVVRYEQRGDDAELSVYAAQSYPNASITVTCADRTLWHSQVDLAPETVFTEPFSLGGTAIEDTVLTIANEHGLPLITVRVERHEDKPVPEPATPLAPPSQVKSIEELYLAATHLIQYRHASSSAADYFLEGLRRDPHDARLNDGWGRFLYRQGRFEESLPFFDGAIERIQWKNPNPESCKPFLHRGLALLMLDRTDEAYDSIFKAVWSSDTQNVAWYWLACLASRKDRLPQAREFVENALVYNTHDMKSRLLKTVLLRRTGEDCQEWIRESLQIDPLDLGLAYEEAVRSGDLEAWQKLMRGDSRNYRLLAFRYVEMGASETALKILKLGPSDHPMTWYAKGWITATKCNDREEALACYRHAETLSSAYCFPNTLEELIVLEHATQLNPDGSFAHYYLGNLLYDAKRHEEALRSWQRSASLNAQFATVHRNLAIAYHNQSHDLEAAFSAISRAQQLDDQDPRILLERDQLAERLAHTPLDRLTFLDRHQSVVAKRDDLFLRRIMLLNCLKRSEEAYAAIMSRSFHPWEGGEGLVSGQYVLSLVTMAQHALDMHDCNTAIDLLKRTLTWPANLGEGRLPQTQDNIACHHLGIAYSRSGDDEQARQWWQRASTGLEKPAPNHYYHDQPSDTIFYQGLALLRLGRRDEASKRFNLLVSYGRKHQFDEVKPDFFAVSLPETSVYHNDEAQLHLHHCHYLLALGNLGLGNVVEAEALLSKIVAENPSHQGALTALELCREGINREARP